MLFFGSQTAAEQVCIGADEAIGHGASENRDCGLKTAIALWPRLPCQQYWYLAFARHMRENAGQILAGQAMSAIQPCHFQPKFN